ncbi:MAG: hypothetical protein SGPRY_015066, partial [Prymnesium sp.]
MLVSPLPAASRLGRPAMSAGEARGERLAQLHAVALAAVLACCTSLPMLPTPFAHAASISEKIALLDEKLAEAEKSTAAESSGPPAMVKAYGLDAYGADEAALKKMSDANSKLTDKAIKRVLDAGIELANKAVDPETQVVDIPALKRSEERFTLIIEELAPNYVGGYTNRANVRVSLKDYEVRVPVPRELHLQPCEPAHRISQGAVRDYDEALRVAPLGRDAWLVKVNRGATLLALGKTSRALEDLEQAVEMSKSDYLALLGRGAVLHKLGQYAEAARDYGAVIDKAPTDIQPFWLRYGLELWQENRQPEALGILRRVANKFDLEPECAIAVSSLLYADGIAVDREEALQRWKLTPEPVRRK